MNLELNIPNDDFESLIELLNTSDDEFNNLIKALKKIPKDLQLRNIEEKLKEITSNYKLILGLYFTFCKFDIPEDKFTQLIVGYYMSHVDIDGDKKGYEKKIAKLFEKNNPIRIAIKSKFLEAEVDKTFFGSKIITDIRPVFSSSEEELIIGRVVTNSLKITYRTNNILEDFFVTLDEEDLKSLKKNIERALKKTKILRAEK